MASMKITCWFVLVLFTAWFSNATSHQDENANAAAEVDAVSRGKKVLNDHHRTVTVAIGQRIGGRRMGAGVQGKRFEKVKGAGAAARGIQFPEEVDQKEFEAFSADYRAPRHHPPKNN